MQNVWLVWYEKHGVPECRVSIAKIVDTTFEAVSLSLCFYSDVFPHIKVLLFEESFYYLAFHFFCDIGVKI
jgi:hypothetical protein